MLQKGLEKADLALQENKSIKWKKLKKMVKALTFAIFCGIIVMVDKNEIDD